MKKISILILILSVSFINSYAQKAFEGTIKWAVKAEFADKAKAEELKKNIEAMNSPENQQKLKALEEQMKDPAFRAQLDANPAMKMQMEQGLAMMQALKQSPDLDPLSAMVPKNISIKTKDSNYIVQMEGGMAAAIGDILYLKKTNKKYSVNTSTKKYSVLPDKKDSLSSKAKVTATNEYEKILEYKCRKYTVETIEKGKKYTQVVWASKEVKDFNINCFSDLKIGDNQSGIDFKKIEGVPLKMVITNEALIISLTTVELNKNAVDPSLFVIPKDYKEVPLPLGK
jgi:hypothetical protein